MDEGGRDPSDNYWSDDFDPRKNCPQEEKIYKLLSEVGAHDLNKDNIMIFSAAF